MISLNKMSTLSENLINIAKSNSTKGIYIINGKEQETFVSYKTLYKKALKVLYNLQSIGLEEGHELILQIKDEKNEQFLYVFWACILGKIIPVPVSVAHKENLTKIIKIFKNLTNPKVIIDEKCYEALRKNEKNSVDNDIIEELENKIVNLDELLIENGIGTIKESKPEDIAYIQFSSGSTMDLKGVVLTNKNLLTNIQDIIDNSSSTKFDSTLSWMPLTHDMGIIGFHMFPLMFNINQSIIRTSLFIRYPVLWIKKVNEHKVSITASSNFGLRYFLDSLKDSVYNDWNLSCIRKIFNGAEPISIDIINEFLSKLSTYGLNKNSMYPVYGMAEASLAVAFPKPNEQFSTIIVRKDKLGIGDKIVIAENKSDKEAIELVDEGYSVNHCSIRIVGREGEVYKEGTVGHIQIKGDNVTKSYYNNPQLTKKIISEDGWLNTMDLGFIRDKKIIITGRSQDIISIQGTTYYSHNIEKECEKLADIVAGRLVACGVFEKNTKEKSLVIFILFKKRIEDFVHHIESVKKLIRDEYKINIRHVIPIKSIPKTTSGKIQRFKLKEMYENGDFKDLIKDIIEITEG